MQMQDCNTCPTQSDCDVKRVCREESTPLENLLILLLFLFMMGVSVYLLYPTIWTIIYITLIIPAIWLHSYTICSRCHYYGKYCGSFPWGGKFPKWFGISRRGYIEKMWKGWPLKWNLDEIPLWEYIFAVLSLIFFYGIAPILLFSKSNISLGIGMLLLEYFYHETVACRKCINAHFCPSAIATIRITKNYRKRI